MAVKQCLHFGGHMGKELKWCLNYSGHTEKELYICGVNIFVMVVCKAEYGGIFTIIFIFISDDFGLEAIIVLTFS